MHLGEPWVSTHGFKLCTSQAHPGEPWVSTHGFKMGTSQAHPGEPWVSTHRSPLVVAASGDAMFSSWTAPL
jgi:hypothetical protein